MKLALAQMLVEPGRPEANLARAEQRVAEAAASGADVVLLPECLDFGWTHPSARDGATSVPDGDTARRLIKVARRRQIFVCAGLVERAGDRLFNSALLIDPDGRVLLHHRKIHELDFARELYATGDRLGVEETPFGRVGVMICADGFAPNLAIGRALGLMGARLILSPCAWAVPAEHDNAREPYGGLWRESYGPVCRETGAVIAGCSNVGPVIAGEWAGRRCIGNSLVMGAKPLAWGDHGEHADQLLLVDLPDLAGVA